MRLSFVILSIPPSLSLSLSLTHTQKEKEAQTTINIHLFTQEMGDTFFFWYLPSSGITPCVGTVGTVHDSYT